jgi:hypothetical protein
VPQFVVSDLGVSVQVAVPLQVLVTQSVSSQVTAVPVQVPAPQESL